MSKPIYYTTEGYNPDGSKINGYPVKTGPFPLPTTGMGFMRKTSMAASCLEAVQKIKITQQKDKNFPRTFMERNVPRIEESCLMEPSKITINIPVKIDVPQAAGRKQRRASTRRRRASRRKVKRTKHSRKRSK
jgi:hypothetical protein